MNAGCKKSNANDAPKAVEAAPVKVPLLTVTAEPTPDVLVLTGTIIANQRSEVTADTSGKVLGVMVDRGTRVKMGDPVVRLDVRNATLSAREAQANLANARVQRTNAEDECRRAKELLDKGAITRSDYDKQNTACQSALQQVSAAEARTDMVTKSVSDGLVRAPFAGIVAEKSVAPGEWVTPGRALFTLVDDNPLKIELSVPEEAVSLVKQGQKVELIAVAFAHKTFSATVTRLGAEIGKTRSLIVEATVDPGSPLLPGMFVEAHLVTGSTVRPVLPESAVVKRGRTLHAFVDVKGMLEDRILLLSAEAPAAGQVAVIAGLVAGEQVVTAVSDQVVDGLRVEDGGPAAAAPAPAATGSGAASASGTTAGSAVPTAGSAAPPATGNVVPAAAVKPTSAVPKQTTPIKPPTAAPAKPAAPASAPAAVTPKQ